MIEVTKEQLDALHTEAFELEQKADCLRQNLIDLQWTINALRYPEEESKPEQKEYPDPAERYEHLHQEEREFELDFDKWLEDLDEH